MSVPDTPAPDKSVHRERFIKYSIIGAGVSVALFPAVYFIWRSRSNSNKLPWSISRLKSVPPPRRIASRVNVGPVSMDGHAQSVALKRPNLGLLLRGHRIDEEESPFSFSWSDVSRSSAWHTFKAFSLATIGLAVFTGTGISLLVWKWNVQDMQDFHDKMRLHVSSLLPSLSSTVHRPVASNASMEGDSLAASIQDADIDAWIWSAAKERLDEAYERGGATAWLAAAARELELERLQLLRQRQESERRRENR